MSRYLLQGEPNNPSSLKYPHTCFSQLGLIISEYNGKVMELGTERRGIFKDLKYMTPQRSSIVYEVSDM